MTGENINYSNSGAGTTQSIGITSTSISGIVTDKLPDSLFVVKVDEGSIRFADSAENALKGYSSDTHIKFCWYWKLTCVYIKKSKHQSSCSN